MEPSDRELMHFLREIVNENRLELIGRVLDQRTRYITVVLEDIYQSQNASAVLRTCDCIGIQDIYVIENRNPFKLNRDVELGSAQWLTLHQFSRGMSHTAHVYNELRQKGYRIVATSPHENDVSLEEFDVEKGPAAFVFGTELSGLSADALEMADEFVKIPMVGFTESYNISVSAALLLYQLRKSLEQRQIKWQLNAAEREEIMYQWIRNSVKNVERIERAFKKSRNI